MNQKFYEKLAEILPEERIKTEEPMQMHTTFRVGGPADYFLMPQTPQEVQKVVSLCKEEGMPLLCDRKWQQSSGVRSGIPGSDPAAVPEHEPHPGEGTVIRAQAGALLSAIAARGV